MSARDAVGETADRPPVGERTVDRGAVTLGVVAGALAGAFATGALALAGGGVAVGVTAVGSGLLVLAGVSDAWWAVDLGAGVMFLGVLVAGLAGGLAGPLLLGTVGTVVAWDAVDHAFSVGHQLGTDTRSDRAVVVHVAASTLVGVVGAGACYGVYLVASGGQPAASLVVLLVGVLLIGRALQ